MATTKIYTDRHTLSLVDAIPICIARDNVGCGSSREHAVWARDDYGCRAVIAQSFADIFFSKCFKNGVLPVILKPEEVQAIFEGVAKNPEASFTIDLPAQQVKLPCGNAFSFEIDAGRKQKLFEGLDEIGLTLKKARKSVV